MNDGAAAQPAKLRFGWILSVLFWLALLFAAALYGVVALSPKLLTWLEYRQRWQKKQEQLVAMERKVHYLKRVAKALETDPEFQAEVARIELDASQPGDERIPVDRELALQAVTPEPTFRPDPPDVWYAFPLRLFAENEPLRRILLGGAVLTVLFAFAYLHESQIGRIRRTAGAVVKTCGGVRSTCLWVKKRYGKSKYSDDGPWGVG